MWQWITYLPLKSEKWPAMRIVSLGPIRKDSLRQSSQGFGGLPLRSSMYQSVWWRWMTWATAVLLRKRQVSVVPSFGRASTRPGLKVLPLISQLGSKPPPTVKRPVRSTRLFAFRAHSGSGRSVAGTDVSSGPGA